MISGASPIQATSAFCMLFFQFVRFSYQVDQFNVVRLHTAITIQSESIVQDIRQIRILCPVAAPKNFTELRRGALKYLPIGAMVGAIFLAELVLVAGGWFFSAEAAANIAAPSPALDGDVTNTHALGLLVYTHYAYLFLVAGLILLVAMIEAIVLTLRTRPGVRKQRVSDQVSRTVEETMAIRKVTPGTGI